MMKSQQQQDIRKLVQLVAMQPGLMSHDLLRGKEKTKRKKQILRIHLENFFHGLFFLGCCSCMEIEPHGDQKFQKN
jgi:hypothetical protein